MVPVPDLDRLRRERSRGALDEVITLRMGLTRDRRGDTQSVLERSTWARREAVEQVEEVSGRATSTPAEVAFTVPYQSDVTPGDEVRDFRGESYRVTRVEDVGRRAYTRLEVLAL